MTENFNSLAKTIDRFFIGGDDIFNKMQKMYEESMQMKIPSYPPYNLRKLSENNYVLELALAGFAKTELDITLDGGNLIIKGETKEDLDNFIYKGIANRAFTRSFTLADNVEVKNADFINGLLKIWLERIIPESKKPKKIEVKDSQESQKQFLTE